MLTTAYSNEAGYSVVAINMDGTAATNLGEGIHPKWSPDRERFSVWKFENATRTVYVQDFGQGVAYRAEEGTSLEGRVLYHSSWAPSGQLLVTTSGPDGLTPTELWLIDLDRKSVQHVGALDSADFGVFDLAVADQFGNIYANVKGGPSHFGAVKLRVGFGVEPTWMWQHGAHWEGAYLAGVSVSPDGQKLIYTGVTVPQYTVTLGTPDGQLGATRQFVTNPTAVFVGWTDDSSAYVVADENKLKRVPLDGGPVTVIPTPSGIELSYGISL